MNTRNLLKIIIIVIAILMPVFEAPTGAAEGQEESVADVDPTRPVIFNVREEFYKLKGEAWINALILRTDIVRLGGVKNFVARFDIPVTSADLGKVREDGLGDLYGQFLLTPYRKNNFYLAVGSGFVFPTASHDILGGGKWQVVPTVAPIWRFQDPKALFVVKIQDFISFAGQDDRADIHYMTVTPVLAMKLDEQWWVAVDTEAKVNWEKDNRWSFKSGLIILRMWTKRFGTSLKPEIPWGANREGDWNLKASFFWNY